MTHRIQLDIPPGRNGLQPDLALIYNSQNTANDSIVGYGWSLSIPYIQVLNKLGSQSLYNARYFTSSIDGELATTSTSTSTYVAKVDSGSFNSYTFNNNVWTMYDKNGTRYTFGASDNAQQNASASSTMIYKWMLQEVRDTNNNYVRYVYFKDGGQIYPSQILYTGNASSDGIFTITFTTASRPDVINNYAPLFTETTNYRISKITASINGATVREYNFSYARGNNGYRSLLSSVQENGWNDSGVETSLPALSFGYISSTTAFVWPKSPYQVYGSGWIVDDANGDGINDITNFYQTGGSTLGSVLVQDQTTQLTPTPPDYWATDPYCTGCSDTHMPIERGVRFVDVNADGKADVVRGVFNFSGQNMTTAMYLNAYTPAGGYSWVSTTTWNGVIPQFELNSGDQYSTGLLGDINGDGLPDYTENMSGNFLGITNGAYFGNGSAWDPASTTIFTNNFGTFTTSAASPARLVDVNGDGLPEFLYDGSCGLAFGGNSCFVPNYGTDWATIPDNTWAIQHQTSFYNAGSAVLYDRGVRYLDINGDGLPDWIHSYCVPSSITSSGPALPELSCENEVALNTGSGWTATSTTLYTLPSYIVSSPPGTWNGYFNYNEYANWTGGGQEAQDVIQTITYPKGGTVTVSYTKTTQQPNANPEMPYSLLVATKIVTSDGLGTSAEKDYAYFGGKQYLARGVRDRQFAGFASSTVTDANSVTTTYFDQGDAISTSLGEQNDGYGQINHPFRVDMRRASDNQLLKQTFDRWDTATTTGGNGVFVFKAREVTQDYGPSGAHRDTATDYAYSTSTGNLTQITNYGEVTGNSDGTFTDNIMGDKSTETFQYAVSTTTQATGLPYDDTLANESSTKVKETRHTYDGLALGSVSLGNETKTENWITSSTYASTTKAYDGTYGLVVQSRDADYNLSTSTLDTYNLYVATTTNALFQTTGYTYDYSTGKTKTTFDANGRLYTATYDGVGRPLTVNEPDPSTGSLVTKTAYIYTDSNTPGSTIVQTTDYLSSASSTNTYLYVDGRGRNLQQRKQFKGNNTYAVKDWTYNNVGLLNTESLPYLASSSARTSATSTSQLFTSYTYDALQRVLNTTNAVGTTSNAYDAWTVTTTDANGKLKDYTKDAYGNLSTVVEHIGTSTATTTYTWDLNKSLTKVTDALGNVRNFTYDGLGRRLTAQDLHASGDSSFGSWSYVFDPAGNLTQVVDPKSQTINYTYDALNRKATEDYTGQAGTEITNTYDTCADGKGRLCIASSTSAQIKYAYNPLGLQGVATTTINGTSTAFATQYSYDRQGNQTLVTYPDVAQVQYNYNTANVLDAVLEKEKTGSFSYLIKNFEYAPTGQVTQAVLGNGATTTSSFNQNALYRLTKKITQLPNGSRAQDFSYTYDALGNILKLADASNSGIAKTVNYSYDDLSRLVSATSTNASTSPNYSYAYSYDALGNITSGPLGTYSYLGNIGTNFANPDATTQIANGLSTTTFSYDNNGNQTSAGTSTLSWDYRATSTFAYDDQDNRVLLTEGSVSTYFPNTLYSVSSATTTKNIFANGMLISTIETTASSTSSGGGGVSTSTIAFDATSTSITTTASGTTTKTWTHTVSGTNPVIVLTADIAQNVAGIGSIASASWNGAAFTKATSTRKNNMEAEVWYLVASTTGAKTMSVTVNGTTTAIRLGAESFTGVSTSSPFEMASSTYGSGGSPSISVTPANATDLVVSTLSKSGGGAGGGGGGISTSTPTYIQSNKDSTTDSVTLTSQPAVGHIIIVGVTANAATIGTGAVTDNRGNTYTRIGEVVNSTTGDHGAIFWAKVVNNTTPFTVTTSVSGTIAAHEYSNVNTWSPLDKVASTTGNSKNPNSTLITTTNDNDLFVGLAWSSGNGDAWTAGGGYNLRQNETNNNTAERIATEDLEIASATTTAAIFGVTTASDWLAMIGAFKPATTTSGGTATTSSDATSSQTTLWKDAGTSTFGGASYKIATSSGTITDTYTTATSTDWVMVSIALRPPTSTSLGGSSNGTTTVRYVANDNIGGSSVITDPQGNVVEAEDFLPFGGIRMDTKTNYGGVRNKYAGTVYDALSNLNYMQARYQNSSRGQFISEDPVFLGDPRQQVLTDPQSLNSYSYANGNPITKSDPTGHCPMCLLAIGGAGAGMLGQYGFDVYNNARSNGFSASDFYSNLSSPQTYFTRAVQGAAIGLTGGAAGALTASVAGQAAIVGTASGVSGVLGNAYLGDPITPQSVLSDTVIGGLTFGAGEMVPRVPGRLPNFGTEAFFSGKHTQQSALQLSYGAMSNYISSLLGSSGGSRNGAVQSYNTSTGASSPSSKLWVTPSGAVVTWGGGIILGPTSVSTPATSRKRKWRKGKNNNGGDVIVYKPPISVMGGGLIILVLVFFGLTLPLLVAGLPVPLGQQLGLAGFWVLGIVLTFAPLGGRLEIGDNYIKTYFFGIATTPEIYRSDIEVITYGNMFIGGMGFGKGIKFRALIGGRSRAYSIGEIIYGKEAIAHARRVLTNVS